jgi:hypothetical protein
MSDKQPSKVFDYLLGASIMVNSVGGMMLLARKAPPSLASQGFTKENAETVIHTQCEGCLVGMLAYSQYQAYKTKNRVLKRVVFEATAAGDLILIAINAAAIASGKWRPAESDTGLHVFGGVWALFEASYMIAYLAKYEWFNRSSK